MSAKCKYGDVESNQEISCEYDPSANTLTCPQPPQQAGAPQKFERLEMDVRFVSAGGHEWTKTLCAKYDEPEDDPLVGSHEVKTLTKKQRRKEKVKKFFFSPLSMTLTNILGEFIGTFLLVLCIRTVVTSSVITGAQVGLWQVSVVAGLGVGLSIYCTAHISDAHLNPAVTLAFAVVRCSVFSWTNILPYIVAQLLGGFCAGGVLYSIYRHAISQYEIEMGIVRGENGSEITAMLFADYFPNAAIYNHSIEENLDIVSPVETMLIEAWSTAILLFVIFSLTDQQNSSVGSGNNKIAVPILIGITIMILVSLYAPLTQAAFNPALDVGPRIFALLLGWGKIAFPGPRNGFWVYIVGPLLGGFVGALVYDCMVAQVMKVARRAKRQKVAAKKVVAD